MQSSKFQLFIQNAFNVLMLIFLVYLIYLIANLMWHNYHIDKKINDLNNAVLVSELENQSFQDYLEYYKSKTYQELELRRRLLLKKPGENVVLLPIRLEEDSSHYVYRQKQLINLNEEKQILPNYYKWWLLIIKGSTVLEPVK